MAHSPSRRPGPLFAALLLAAVLPVAPAATEELEVDREASVLAVVTGKAGLASGLVHQHLVVGRGYSARLDHDPAVPEATRFELEVRTAELTVDEQALWEAWHPRLAELSPPIKSVTRLGPKKRAKVRRSMLATGQLDVENHPAIRAEVMSIRKAEGGENGELDPADYIVELALTIKGETVTRPMAATYSWTGERLSVECAGTFRFTDFGIEPYSTALGAFKVRDGFRVFLHLEAGRSGSGQATDAAPTQEPEPESSPSE